VPDLVSVAVSLSLVLATSLAGPPKLPPMPGQSTPSPEPTPTKPDATKPDATKPSATKPTTPPPAKPAPAAPAKPEPAPVPPTGPAAAPATVPTPSFSPPVYVEPPQPDVATVPPPAAAPAESNEPAPSSNRRVPLPDADKAEEEAAVKKMPPPSRPPYRGIALFAGAGAMFAVALAEQIASHVIVKRRCIEPVAKQAEMTDPFDDETDAEEIGNAIIECVPGVLPVVALRVNSDLALVAMIGMATAGAILRADRTAYDHAFAMKRNAKIARLRGAGIGLIAVGATTWLTLGPASWGVLAKCDDAKCATRARAMGFSMRDVGAVFVAAGAAMLAFSETYRRKHEAYSRERAILWAPAIGRGYAGISLMQRF
jgi:hypothetical protein